MINDDKYKLQWDIKQNKKITIFYYYVFKYLLLLLYFTYGFIFLLMGLYLIY